MTNSSRLNLSTFFNREPEKIESDFNYIYFDEVADTVQQTRRARLHIRELSQAVDLLGRVAPSAGHS